MLPRFVYLDKLPRALVVLLGEERVGRAGLVLAPCSTYPVHVILHVTGMREKEVTFYL